MVQTVGPGLGARDVRRSLPARGAVLAGLAVTIAITLAYALGVVVPYYVNDLDALPLTEVASGAHDPKDMWPSTAGWVGGLLRTAGIFAMWLILLVQAPIAVAALASLVARRSAGLVYLWPHLVIVVISASAAAVQLSPFGQALSLWALD